MKTLIILLCMLVSSTCLLAQHDHKKAEQSADTVKKSIPKGVHAQVDDNHMMIHYYAPAVRGRTIWGGLVPYGEVWVTALSNDLSPRLLGSRRWKKIQQWSYALFFLIAAHAIMFQVIEKRVIGFIITLDTLVFIPIVVQTLGAGRVSKNKLD